jgi:hypothetical protein
MRSGAIQNDNSLCALLRTHCARGLTHVDTQGNTSLVRIGRWCLDALVPTAGVTGLPHQRQTTIPSRKAPTACSMSASLSIPHTSSLLSDLPATAV